MFYSNALLFNNNESKAALRSASALHNKLIQ